MATITRIVNTALSGIRANQREVLLARFGLEKESGKGETLAAIGERLKVTRERVRQIESAAAAAARANLEKNAAAAGVIEKVRKYLAARGGVARRSDVVQYAQTLIRGLKEHQLDFLAEISGAFSAYAEDADFTAFYYATDKDLKGILSFVESWIAFLESHKEKVLAGSAAAYETQFANFTKARGATEAAADNYLALAKHIRKNPYGDVGLRHWPEIRPMTVRDKIYLVLKKKGAPLHFEDIAKHINRVGFDNLPALAPTVHNELIKDGRFVLVGRGMYGLKEAGYEPGTAREVIAKVLKHHGPLAPTDVVTRVNEQRFFKPNTILINLQNRSRFERLADGRYRVREA